MEYGCIGEKLGHSFSREIHYALGDYLYEQTELSENQLNGFMNAKNFKGINVTIPYKEKVLQYLDYLDFDAEKIGAVNTIVNKNGKLFGYNTDFFGMSALLNRENISLKNKTVAILGTGGTSKTAAAVAKNENCKKCFKVSRTKTGEDIISYSQFYEIKEQVQVIINTTPVGMFPDCAGSAVNLNGFSALEAIVDAVYNPITTDLIKKGRELGIKSVNGLYMLVAQAAKSAELFFDDENYTAKINRVFENLLFEKINIVLIGMPGSGKTTVGQKLFDKTNKELIDTDKIFTEKFGCITDYFDKNGENNFRKEEKKIIIDIFKENNKIISTGGGIIKDRENMDFLKKNGIVVFLDRSIEKIIPTSDRPLADTKEKIKKLYSERHQKYTQYADLIINGDNDAEKVSNEIILKIKKMISE